MENLNQIGPLEIGIFAMALMMLAGCLMVLAAYDHRDRTYYEEEHND